MSKKGEQEKGSAWWIIIPALIVIKFLLVIVLVVVPEFKASIESDKELKAIQQMIKETIEIENEPKENLYLLDEKETPYRYVLAYRINPETDLVKRDEVYVYNPIRMDAENTFGSMLDSAVEAEIYVRNERTEGFIHWDEKRDLSGMKVVGKGSTVEEIKDRYPDAMIIAEGEPLVGKLVIKSGVKLEEGYDFERKIETQLVELFSAKIQKLRDQEKK